MSPDREGFVPVDSAAIRALFGAASQLEDAERQLEEATAALLELAEDMSREAVRRLTERGASEAQIARYEAAFRRAARSLTERRASLAEACRAMRAAVAEVR